MNLVEQNKGDAAAIEVLTAAVALQTKACDAKFTSLAHSHAELAASLREIHDAMLSVQDSILAAPRTPDALRIVILRQRLLALENIIFLDPNKSHTLDAVPLGPPFAPIPGQFHG
jgi:hypothetical protein